MNKVIDIYLYNLIFILISTICFAQQDPQFSHYMYNMNVVNPAYATQTQETTNLGGFYRTQWVGAVGAPKTATLFGHIPISEKIEMGLSVINDAIGDGVVSENNIYADFAYVIPVSERTKISFGVKGGVTLFNTNFDGFKYTSIQQDLAFANNISQAFPNVGFGTYLFSDKYYVGISAPNVLTTKHLEKQNGIQTTGVEAIHFFATAGYVFDLNENYKLKPAFMAKAVLGAPLSVDFTTNILINNKFEFGLGYRLDDSVSALTTISVKPNIRIGYSYDYTLSNLGNFNSGSHELFLLFDLGKKSNTTKGGYDKSPRFF